MEMPAHLPKKASIRLIIAHQEGEHASVLRINPFAILDDIATIYTG